MTTQKSRAILAGTSLALIAMLAIAAFPLGGDIAIIGGIPIIGTQNTTNQTPNITTEKICCGCQKATTFVWTPYNGTYAYPYYNYTGTLRVHVNFDQAITVYFPNVLAVINGGNLSGAFNLTIIQTAKIGSTYLSAYYTQFITVYINHDWQNSSNMGTLLTNNTAAGPFQLYNYPPASYYIGVVYTIPSGLPPYVQSNLNALGQYITFNFAVQLN